MRALVAEVRAFVAMMDMALELERVFGVTITEAELESIQCPSDFAQYLQGSQRRGNVEASIVAALALVRRTSADERDLHRTFAELFPLSWDA
ncbi:MAG: hypothetical protein U1F68_04205 [Gammaproteobacteria bacterium]